MMDKRIIISLPLDLYEGARRLAKKRYLSFSALVRQSLAERIEPGFETKPPAAADPVLGRFLKSIGALRRKIREIYLFGSRARGEERQDSDYDLLVIMSDDFTLSDKDFLYDRLTEVLLETGAVISLKIFEAGEFKKLVELGTPFIQNVLQERVRVG